MATAITQAKLVHTAPNAISAELASILRNAPSPVNVPQGEFWNLAFQSQVLDELCRIREELLRDC
jgi:hypothetical protein